MEARIAGHGWSWGQERDGKDCDIIVYEGVSIDRMMSPTYTFKKIMLILWHF